MWLKSRVPGASARLREHWIDRIGAEYAEIVRGGLRFRFSHEAVLRDEAGKQETWLVFVHDGPAGRG